MEEKKIEDIFDELRKRFGDTFGICPINTCYFGEKSIYPALDIFTSFVPAALNIVLKREDQWVISNNINREITTLNLESDVDYIERTILGLIINIENAPHEGS